MKPTDATAYIHALIAQGEHVQQDFKYEISDARKIARTLSAFANSLGGRLLIGVKDNGRIAGVRSEEEMYMIEAAAQLYCTPKVDVIMKAYRVEGRTVLCAEVPEAQQKPVKAYDENNKAWAYIRIADENILATAVHMLVWQQGNDIQPYAMAFTDRERAILAVLSQEEECSLSRLCRVTKLSQRVVQMLLSRFVCWGIVGMRYNGCNFVYRCLG